MASTQKAYYNPDERESEKSPSPFSRRDQIRASTLAERHRNLLVAMLHKNRFGDELWMSTESICVVMGRVCYRRKKGGWSAHEKPRQLSDCEHISRRAVQRLIDEVVELGILTQLYGDNKLVPYGGGKKFRHTATYRLNPDKLVPRKTHDQYVEERDRARAQSRQKHREESEREKPHVQADVTPIRKEPKPSEAPKSPAPAAPLPAREKPAAEHRSSQRGARKLTPREGPRLVNEMRRLMQGAKGHVGQDRLWIEYSPTDPRYRAPMSQENALVAACMNLAIPEEAAREFLKLLPRADLGESEKEPGPSSS